MDEASRFLRYVMPGLSFVAQTILLLWVLLPLGLASELRIGATTPVSALLSRNFFDPTPEQQDIVLIDALTLRKAEQIIESCKQCNPG